MAEASSSQQAFVEWVLNLLEERFPWLGKDEDAQISGADTVDELVDLHRSLINRRTESRLDKPYTDQ
jgi:hypothetical protein